MQAAAEIKITNRTKLVVLAVFTSEFDTRIWSKSYHDRALSSKRILGGEVVENKIHKKLAPRRDSN